MNSAGKRAAATLSLQPAPRAYKPGARQLRSSPFVTCRAFILPGANSRLLLAQNTVPAEKRTRALLLPKHAWAIHVLSQRYVPPHSASPVLRSETESSSAVSRTDNCARTRHVPELAPATRDSLYLQHIPGQSFSLNNLHSSVRSRCSLHGPCQFEVPPRTLQAGKDQRCR